MSGSARKHINWNAGDVIATGEMWRGPFDGMKIAAPDDCTLFEVAVSPIGRPMSPALAPWQQTHVYRRTFTVHRPAGARAVFEYCGASPSVGPKEGGGP